MLVDAASEEFQAKQLEQVRRASLEIRLLSDAWYRIKTLPEWNQRLSIDNSHHVVLSALVARQGRLLIAVDACSRAGSDQAATILCRSIFESFLCSLALSFGRDEEATNRLLELLIDHKNHQVAHSLKSDLYKEALGRLGIPESTVLDAAAQLASSRKPEKKDNNWHDLRNSSGRISLEGVRDYLWPSGQDPVFRSFLPEITRELWDSLWEIYWSNASDITHTSGISVFDYLTNSRGGLIDDGPRFSVHQQVHAALMFRWSGLGLANQAILLREFEMETQQPIIRLLQIQLSGASHLKGEQSTHKVQF